MDMPYINECAVDMCSYNVGSACHALAITVGDPPHAQCDTYFITSFKGGDPASTGQVGACKMTDCRHNSRLECRARGIAVGPGREAADCLTYSPR
ncbi:DUF1540 domain-containing protein [Streptomyces sp. NRRL S-813]|uniref:DUF1540 domain-containing protein n=1 Tax=Streptomyces sp. NRRL S-813 TaxID=1463919 RepID=UPI0004C03CCA|nr:DUF1540 domain-containing protein [Streptomyces sp. NRRL S-813]